MAKGTPNSDELRERVLSLYRDGYSAGMISRMIGDDLGVVKSRNAIIGIINRAGVRAGLPRSTRWRLNRHGLPVEQMAHKPAAQRAERVKNTAKLSAPKTTQARVSNNRVGGRALRPFPVAAPDAPAVADGGVPLVELQQHHCRAISGRGADGLATFCGADKVHGSYCAAHARMFYAPTKHVTRAQEANIADALSGAMLVKREKQHREHVQAVDHVLSIRAARGLA